MNVKVFQKPIKRPTSIYKRVGEDNKYVIISENEAKPGLLIGSGWNYPNSYSFRSSNKIKNSKEYEPFYGKLIIGGEND